MPVLKSTVAFYDFAMVGSIALFDEYAIAYYSANVQIDVEELKQTVLGHPLVIRDGVLSIDKIEDASIYFNQEDERYVTLFRSKDRAEYSVPWEIGVYDSSFKYHRPTLGLVCRCIEIERLL